MYNRYIGNTGKFYRVGETSAPAVRRGAALPERPPPAAAEHPIQKPPPVEGGGLGREHGLLNFGGLLKNFSGLGSFLKPGEIKLPFGLDIGDILLLVLLLLLYLDSNDEEFLIILIILGYGIIKGSK